MSEERCIWKVSHYNGYDYTFKTSCGESETIPTPIDVGISFPMTPKRARMKFCHYCGKKIRAEFENRPSEEL